MKIDTTNPQKHFIIILYFVFFVTFLGLTFTTISVIQNILGKEIVWSFCFDNNCLKNTYSNFEYSIKLLVHTFSVSSSLITVGGIYVALLSYVNSVQSNNLNNHISHFKIFSDYVMLELEKHNRLALSSFDIFKWYNLIFSKSRTGSMNVSDKYISEIKRVNEEIIFSNEQSRQAKNGSFRYKNHQERMIQAFDNLGIAIGFHPRNDFYDIEGQLIELISVINKSFCTESSVGNLNKREYI
ncbi:retron Ec48 family effector membrane protein [Agarivorans sp. DSG3-1]|uniref:retron Ec48 family effector membrane protein n=1 Tax=Agarivorans sp. DSG3-1 TaxID=3342249 RepID=UPI00398E31FD